MRAFPSSRPTSWWGDRTVRTKVLAAVGAAALAGTCIGVVGIRAVDDGAANSKDLLENHVTGVVTVADMVDDVQSLRVVSRNAVLSESPAAAQAALAQVPDVLSTYDQNQQVYSGLELDADREALITQAGGLVDQWSTFFEQTLTPLALAGDVKGWVAANNANLLLTDASEVLAQLRDIENVEARAAAEDSASAASSARTQVLVFLVVGMALALLLGWFVATGVARATQRVRDVVEGWPPATSPGPVASPPVTSSARWDRRWTVPWGTCAR